MATQGPEAFLVGMLGEAATAAGSKVKKRLECLPKALPLVYGKLFLAHGTNSFPPTWEERAS